MKNLITILLVTSLFQKLSSQVLIKTQSKEHPLYTELDSAKLLPFKDVFNFAKFNLSKCLEFREFLEPYVQKNDPKAIYLYAKTYDLFSFGLGDSVSAKVAMKNYKKAANFNYSDAEFNLFGIYKYSFLHENPNKELSVKYLHLAIEHGNNNIKLKGYKFLSMEIEGNASKIYYLKKILEIDENNTWALDYLASLYEKNANFSEASKYLKRTENENSQLKLAEWLIDGDKIEQDIEAGLQIIYKVYDKIQAMDKAYMGSKNPVHILCRYYKCKKIITKEQLRGIDLTGTDCCF